MGELVVIGSVADSLFLTWRAESGAAMNKLRARTALVLTKGKRRIETLRNRALWGGYWDEGNIGVTGRVVTKGLRRAEARYFSGLRVREKTFRKEHPVEIEIGCQRLSFIAPMLSKYMKHREIVPHKGCNGLWEKSSNT